MLILNDEMKLTKLKLVHWLKRAGRSADPLSTPAQLLRIQALWLLDFFILV